jgi:polar amino acid transport system substrate-binding protein
MAGDIKKKAERSPWVLIPVLCLIFAVAVLYARPDIGNWVSPHPQEPPVLEDGRREAAVTIHYHERPPYYVTGPLGVYGLCVDPVKKAFLAAGIPVKWVKTPAARQLDLLKFNGPDTCIIGWFKNPEREKIAVYSHYIYQDRPTVALARSDNSHLVSRRPLAEILENHAMVLLRKQGYSYGRFVDDMIDQYRPNQKTTTAENIGMLNIIHKGLADYFFISEEEALDLVQTSGLLAQDFKLVRFVDVPAGNRRYLMYSKKMDKDIIEKVNAAIFGQRAAGLTPD